MKESEQERTARGHGAKVIDTPFNYWIIGRMLSTRMWPFGLTGIWARSDPMALFAISSVPGIQRGSDLRRRRLLSDLSNTEQGPGL